MKTYHEALGDRSDVAVCKLECEVQRAVASLVARLECVRTANASADLRQVAVLRGRFHIAMAG